MIRIIQFTVCLICLSVAFWSEASAVKIGKRLAISSTVLNEQREIQIWLPEGYYSQTDTTFPVIYLLDGDYNFHAVSGMLDMLSNKGQLIPDVILVGIADKGTERYREFMTPHGLNPDEKKDTGKAAIFLRFLQEEVKPYVQKHYRVAGNDMLMGQSIGGLFVLNALLRSATSFDHYVAVSPAVWLHDNAFVKQAKDILGNSEHPDVSLYLSLGDETRMGAYSHEVDHLFSPKLITRSHRI